VVVYLGAHALRAVTQINDESVERWNLLYISAYHLHKLIQTTYRMFYPAKRNGLRNCLDTLLDVPVIGRGRSLPQPQNVFKNRVGELQIQV
jgi:hypothetical protein